MSPRRRNQGTSLILVVGTILFLPAVLLRCFFAPEHANDGAFAVAQAPLRTSYQVVSSQRFFPTEAATAVARDLSWGGAETKGEAAGIGRSASLLGIGAIFAVIGARIGRASSGSTLRAVADDGQGLEAPADEEDVFVKPSLWNRPMFRAAVLAGVGAYAGKMVSSVSLLHLAAFSTVFGTGVWTTFIAGITMFQYLPKQTFGKLQARLFPKYFQLSIACLSVALITAYRMGLPTFPLAIALKNVLSNQVVVGPASTRVMLERYDRQNKGLKDESYDKKLNARFGMLHGLSSLLNLITLACLVAHGISLAARIRI